LRKRSSYARTETYRTTPEKSVIGAKAPISSNDGESLAAVRAETENCEGVVEGRRALDAQPAHDGKARSIDDGKILVTVRDFNMPGGFQVRHAYRFDCCNAGSHAFPEPLRGLSPDAVPQQGPSLHQHVIGSEQRLATFKDDLCTGIAGV
jgi:hypothetical protein